MSQEPQCPAGLEWLLEQSAGSEASHRERLASLGKAQLVTILMQLSAWILGLLGLIKDLRAQLAQNSKNSSRPPGSDVNKPKPNPKSGRKRTGKKPGGQPGHPGETLKQVENPTRSEKCPLPESCTCGRNLSEAKVIESEKRQVFDLPEPQPLEVTEYISDTVQCKCGRVHKAEFPEEVTQPAQYGPRMEATVTYFNLHQLVPYKRTQQLFEDMFGVHLSQGTIKNILHRAYLKLEGFQRRMTALLINTKVVHFDETGMRVRKKLHWLHVACTDKHTLYHIDERRGDPAMIRMGILPHFTGRAVHDHWASYFKYDNCEHGLCNTHHGRELVYAYEQYQQVWADKLLECLLEANAEVTAAKAKGRSSLPPDRLEYFSERYSRILRNGREELNALPAPSKTSEPEPGEEASKQPGRKKQHKVKNLHDRLVEHKKETLAFMYDFNVPYTNNQGEQDVRMSKVKQKISGCFRSILGAEMYARIRSFASTATKQGHKAVEAFTALFKGDETFIHNLTEQE
jgi:transposase